MNKTPFLLTFEWDPTHEVLEIHADKNGLERLRDSLELLINLPENDHIHLMTPLWGGDELTAEIQSVEDTIINHVKIFKWVTHGG